MSRNSIVVYVLLAIAISWAIQIPTIMIFGLGSDVTSAVFLLVMWTPSLLALIFIARNPEVRNQVLWRLGKVVYLPLGIVVQMAIGLGVVGILVSAGIATSGWFTFQLSGVEVAGGPWLLGQGFQAWPHYVLNIIVTSIVFSIFNLLTRQ
ncbi:hypothetical protein [Microbulbifer taiwanensis]|uniref:Uncharacterized protein n=1 Tax=Microbulbifer taiwanensis TaxID=986746 RepID=A0ABW1YGZ0_9GAMM|nr:hypothetical protein [Microbulbifer taiwanensis]